MTTRTLGSSETAFAAVRDAMSVAIVLVGTIASVVAGVAEEQIRLSDLYATLNEVASHARAYPPQFSSAEERAQTEGHLKTLLKQLDKISDRYPDDKDILFMRGAANAMAHNLDFPGCTEKVIAAFDRLLTIDPDNRRAQYEYGGFLSGTTLLDKAIPHLQKAIQLGEERAHYTLAFVYVKKSDPQKALPEFEAYLKVDPDNATAKRFVSDIQSGRFSARVVRHEGTEEK